MKRNGKSFDILILKLLRHRITLLCKLTSILVHKNNKGAQRFHESNTQAISQCISSWRKSTRERERGGREKGQKIHLISVFVINTRIHTIF